MTVIRCTMGWMLAALLTGCANLNNLNNNKTFAFDLQGHRGCRGLMPENTIPAMLHAIDLGVNTLEMDASITKDSVVILSHEPFFNHEITTKPDGTAVSVQEERSLNMYRMTYDEVKRYDVGLKSHPRFPQQQKLPAVKPRLADLIDSVEAYCKAHKKRLPFYNIETKTTVATDEIYHPKPGPFVELLMSVIRDKQIADRVIIQSFDIRTLQYLHDRYPDMKTALLIEEGDTKAFALQLKDLGFIPTIYSPFEGLVTPLLVKQCRDMNIRLIPWTVNDPQRIEALRQMGVNGIITDYPPKGNMK